MKILATSDLHGHLPNIEESCDILFIVGDICPTISHDKQFQKDWIQHKFIPWVNTIKTNRIIIIPGNHDFYFEDYGSAFELLSVKTAYRCTLLSNNTDLVYSEVLDRAFTVISFPFCKKFGNWAFMPTEKDYNKAIRNLHLCSPEILLCHQPPLLCNLGTIQEGVQKGTECGCPELAKFIMEEHPKLVLCGHIHSGNHNKSIIKHDNGDVTLCANVSLCNEKYQPVNKIFKLEYEKFFNHN